MVACNGGSATIPDAAAPDAAPPDIRDGGDRCSALGNVGCLPPERCTFVHPASPDGEFVPRCAPAGSLEEGDACVAIPGEFDDCVATTLCFWGECRPLCNVAFLCESGACGAQITHPDLTYENVCYPACNPLQPDCMADFGCYFPQHFPDAIPEDVAACLPAGTRAPGDPCSYSQQCKPGLVCILDAETPFDVGDGVCVTVCDVAADDCDVGAACVAYQGRGYGACVPE